MAAVAAAGTIVCHVLHERTQVGIAKRFIAMNTELGLLTIINPRGEGDCCTVLQWRLHLKPASLCCSIAVLWRSPETFLVWDDCFSVPRCMVRRRRPVSMSFCFLDDSGTHRVWEHCPRDVTELIEHEMDHLDGVLMSDYPEEPLETAFLKREQYLQDREKWDRELREFDKPSHPQQPRQRVMCI